MGHVGRSWYLYLLIWALPRWNPRFFSHENKAVYDWNRNCGTAGPACCPVCTGPRGPRFMKSEVRNCCYQPCLFQVPTMAAPADVLLWSIPWYLKMPVSSPFTSFTLVCWGMGRVAKMQWHDVWFPLQSLLSDADFMASGSWLLVVVSLL